MGPVTTPAQFTSRRLHSTRTAAALAILTLLFGASPLQATDFKQPAQPTLDAWDAYVQLVDSTMVSRAAGSMPFLYVDESPDLVQSVRTGGLVVTNIDPREVPHGLIHHWVGAMFIPNVTLDRVATVIGNYERYGNFYQPFVARSAVLERAGDTEKVNLLVVQKAYSVTAAVDTDYQVQIVRLDANRIYIVSKALRIQEIADYGQPSEHPFPEDRRPGYVWRTMGVTRLEQRDGGVYVEMETIALSRGIPAEFRWLIKPLTDKLPRNIMFQTLAATRAAVIQQTAPPQSNDQNIAQSTAH
jgi:hypothetical protein